MITLSLLHPIKQIPVQVWTFPNETTIRIGRSTDNQVILYSAVVSRHHVELRRVGANWEIVSLGTNGTYLDGKRITQVPVTDGAIIRLARSGPNIQIRIGEAAVQKAPKALEGERTVGQRHDYPPVSQAAIGLNGLEAGDIVEPDDDGKSGISSTRGIIPVPPHLQLPTNSVTGIPHHAPEASHGVPVAIASQPLQAHPAISTPVLACTHQRGGSVFCVDCGHPLHVLQTVGDYQLLKVLGQGDIGVTYQAWHAGQTLALKTLQPEWLNNPKAQDALECEAETLRHLNHPQIPHLIDFFAIADHPYLVMEMMPGQTLAQHIASAGWVTPERAIAWIIQLCHVLDYIHHFTPPILHRGINPSSLIYQRLPHTPDSLALVDFGAIKAMVLGKAALPLGSTGYNAPEQLDMNATPRVDLYPMAPLLAYLLTGQHPIAFYAEREQGYRFCADLVPGILPALANIMQTLTHPEPDQRYATARTLATALKDLNVKTR